MFPLVDPRIEDYQLHLLGRHDDPVLNEMEDLAEANQFPIVGRICGAFLEMMALTLGAKSVFELGSGYGYSAYWFTRAVGSDGVVFCTDSDPANRDLAEQFLGRSGRWEQVRYQIGNAQESLASTPGVFDIVYNDVDKIQYPDTWLLSRERIRPGGLYICDNVLRGGQVLEKSAGKAIEAVKLHNDLITSDPEFDSFILPNRDGMIVARRRLA